MSQPSKEPEQTTLSQSPAEDAAADGAAATTDGAAADAGRKRLRRLQPPTLQLQPNTGIPLSSTSYTTHHTTCTHGIDNITWWLYDNT